MPLFQPIAIACQPGSQRVDYFAVAPDAGDTHAVWWLGPSPDREHLPVWESLGGGGGAIDAEWMGDGSALIVILLGEDGRIWENSYGAATGQWNGWTDGGAAGELHKLLVDES